MRKNTVAFIVSVLLVALMILGTVAIRSEAETATSYTEIASSKYSSGYSGDALSGSFVADLGLENVTGNYFGLDGLNLIFTTDASEPNNIADGAVNASATTSAGVSVTISGALDGFFDTVTYVYLVNDTSLGEVTITYTGTDGASHADVVLAEKGIILLGEATGETTATVMITSATAANASAVAVFKAPLGKGTFKLNGVTLTESVSLDLEENSDFSYSAEPASGWAFYGLRVVSSPVKYFVLNVSLSTSVISGTGSGSSINFTDNTTVEPIFVPADAALFEAGTAKYYPFLDEAAENVVANGSAQINLHKSGQAYHSLILTGSEATVAPSQKVFELPEGVALVIPYAIGTTAIDATGAAGLPYALYEIKPDNTPVINPASANVNLTLRSGYKLTVGKNGKLIVGGTLTSGQSKDPGSTTGNYARLELARDSEIVLAESSVLSVCGYVTGEGVIDATASGVKVYQPLAILDYRGGSYTYAAYSDKATFPFTTYAIKNIRASFTLSDDSAMYTYQMLYIGSLVKDTYTACAQMIGAKSANVLIGLHEGAKVHISYDDTKCAKSYVGQSRLTFVGDVDFKALVVPFKNPLTSQNMNISSDYATFILPYTISARVAKGSTLTLTEKCAIFPGSEIYVEEGAFLQADADLVVLDGLYDTIGITPQYPNTATLINAGFFPAGRLVVDGKLTTAAAFGGIVQTQSNSSILQVGGAVSVDFYHGFSGKSLGNTYQYSSRYSITGRVYNASQNKLVALEKGKTYYGRKEASYTGLSSYTYVPREYKSSFLWGTVEDKAAVTVNYGSTVTFLGEWGTHKTVYQSSAATDADVVDVHVAMGSYSTAAAPGLSQAEWYDGTYRYKGAGTWTQNSEANNCRIFVPSSKTKVGFTTYADSTRGDKCTITEEYRLNDYIWLNASFYLNSTLSPSNLQATVETVGSENDAQLVVVGEQVYIVMKVYSDDLANEWELTLTYNENGTLLTETIVLSLEDYRQKLGKSHKHYYLLGAMIDYGTASDEYFNVNGTVSSAQKFEVWGPENYREKQFDARNQYNGVQLKTTGATVYFNNCLALAMQFRTNGTVTLQNGDRIVQIGLLAGTSSQYIEGQEQLLTDDHAYDQAFILYGAYGSQNGTDDKPGKPSGQASSGSNGVLSECPTISNSMMISFDLTNDQYLQRYALRPFIVIEHANGTYLNLYGEQYLYGLESYCASVNANSTNNDSKNLAYYAWNYAQIAANVAY